ncbi:MAG: hypothetical protein ACJ8G3_11570 [Burkholderiaceae bacterium]
MTNPIDDLIRIAVYRRLPACAPLPETCNVIQHFDHGNNSSGGAGSEDQWRGGAITEYDKDQPSALARAHDADGAFAILVLSAAMAGSSPGPRTASGFQ